MIDISDIQANAIRDWARRERARQERELLRKQQILENAKSNPALFEKLNSIIDLL